MKTKIERKLAVEEDGEDAYLIDIFARRETEAQRAHRIARKTVNPETAEALRRLWAATDRSVS